MTHRILAPLRAGSVAALLLVSGLVARPLAAQILRVPEAAESRRPIFTSLSIGFLDTQDRYDGQSGSAWLLGQAISWRGSLEMGIRAGALGVAASVASVPISRTGTGARSDGDIQLRQYLATFRTPETQGFHQIVELGVGLAQWASYSGTDVLTDEEAKARNALALAVGYGFGFRLADRASIHMVQDLGTLIGSKEGIPSGVSRSVRQYTTRIGMRLRLTGGR